MPGNNATYVFSASYIEHLHDRMLELFWPGVEPVSPDEYRDLGMIESALSRPFQTFEGALLIQGIERQGAALFHSLSPIIRSPTATNERPC